MVEDVGPRPGPHKPAMIKPPARSERPRTTTKDTKDGPRRTHIVVLLNSKPRDYVPGSGPPLQRARLLPPHDSTAYIVDRILLPSPGPAANGKPMPKRMTYIIGWHDLPAARLLVPAIRILDYVSPYVLEEWEWNLEQELEDERAKIKEESKILSVSGKNTPARGQVTNKKKKKKPRPPAHSQIEAAAVVDLEAEAQATPRPAKGAMSLSTPQKARLEEFEELSDEESSPSRQVEEELLASLKKQQQTVPLSQVAPDPFFGGLPRQFLPPVHTPPVKNGMEYQDGLHAALKHTPLPSLRPDPPPPNHEFSMSFTPIFPRQQQSSALNSPLDTSESHLDETPSEKPTKRRKKPRSQKPLEEDGEPVWEVDRLEDAQWFDVEGRGLVRYFKVRWVGDWPPDQNPSWEPEENIPANLVRNYLKNPKRNAKSAKPAAKRKREALPWAPEKKYSSVSEAFAAEDDDAMDLVGRDVQEHFSEDTVSGRANGDDELFVVEEGTDLGRGRLQTSVARSGIGAFGSAESGFLSAYLR
ncbi:hypothetical protein HJFPF1_06149 [Paramyrothecium foliicola]|nr:hypothetical protein HJFPF1_06149 [Paramyrothecium foliicola]